MGQSLVSRVVERDYYKIHTGRRAGQIFANIPHRKAHTPLMAMRNSEIHSWLAHTIHDSKRKKSEVPKKEARVMTTEKNVWSPPSFRACLPKKQIKKSPFRLFGVCNPARYTSPHPHSTRRRQGFRTCSVGAARTHTRYKAVTPNRLSGPPQKNIKKGQSCSPVNLFTISSPSRWCCPRGPPCTSRGCVHSFVLAS